MSIWKSGVHTALLASLVLVACEIEANAYQIECNCSVYIFANDVDALVIDNTTGWHEQVPGTTRHTKNLQPVIGLPDRTSAVNAGAYSDWSDHTMKCVELKHFHAVFAFRAGNVGQSYSCRGAQFKIEAIGTQPHDETDKIYWISSRAGYPFGNRNFVYSQKRGIVSFGAGVPRNVGERQMFLVAGPGLLGPGGLPNSSMGN